MVEPQAGAASFFTEHPWLHPSHSTAGQTPIPAPKDSQRPPCHAQPHPTHLHRAQPAAQGLQRRHVAAVLAQQLLAGRVPGDRAAALRGAAQHSRAQQGVREGCECCTCLLHQQMAPPHALQLLFAAPITPHCSNHGAACTAQRSRHPHLGGELRLDAKPPLQLLEARGGALDVQRQVCPHLHAVHALGACSHVWGGMFPYTNRTSDIFWRK